MIFPPEITTVPRSIAVPVPVRIRPFVIAITGPETRETGSGPETGPDPDPLAPGVDPKMLGFLAAIGSFGRAAVAPGLEKGTKLGSGPVPAMKSRRGWRAGSERSYISAPSMKTRSAFA